MYEIWVVIEDSGEFIPFTKEYESSDFSETYNRYINLSENGMFVIIQKPNGE